MWQRLPHHRWNKELNVTELRPSGGNVTRFKSFAPHADREKAALAADHPAIITGTTIFQRSIKTAETSPRLLVSGIQNPKLGRRVLKGPWRGCFVYQLTLVERETCPSTCSQWRECFGNAMPLARRHRYDAALVERLPREIAALMTLHAPHGIVVRLHNLGDFPDVDYAARWVEWMDEFPRLHVFGYTAHPIDSPIGSVIQSANLQWPDRFLIRFSVSPDREPAPRQATTIWRQPASIHVDEGMVCPAQLRRPDGRHVTDACVTCGLCWNVNFADTRIVFVGHGMKKTGGRKGGRTAS